MKEVCYRISGRVQRVGFRYWTLRQIKQIGNISGYVMNMENGDVCIYVLGENKSIEILEKTLYNGPLFARVDNVKYSPHDIIYFPKIEDGAFKII